MNNIHKLVHEEATPSDKPQVEVDNTKMTQNEIEHKIWLESTVTKALLKQLEVSTNMAVAEIANLCVQGGSDTEIRVRGVRLHTLIAISNTIVKNKIN